MCISAYGINLPEAYGALARNPLVLYPTGDNQYTVNSVFQIWASHTDRRNDMQPIESKNLQVVWMGANIEDAYSALYANVKLAYPSCIDAIVSQNTMQPPTMDISSATDVTGAEGVDVVDTAADVTDANANIISNELQKSNLGNI